MQDIVNRLIALDRSGGLGGTAHAWIKEATEEIMRLRSAVRINGLRAGHSDEEIDKVLYPDRNKD